MIEWRDGLEKSPDGAWMRQVPQHAWSSSLWTSKDGQVWRRYYNAVTKEWFWNSEGPVAHVENESGHMGVHLQRGWTPIETVIALAWLYREPEKPMRVEVKEGKPVAAKYIKWQQPEHFEEHGAIRGESWSALKHWRCGLVKAPDGYMISSEGRLKAPNGEVTSGFWFEGMAGPTRLAAIRGCGLVDLWVAAKLIPKAVYLKPHLKLAADAMMSGLTPEELALSPDTSIQTETAWTYYRQVAEHAPVARLREVAEAIVDRHLLQLLREMRKEEVMGGPLKPLMEVVQDRLPARSAFWRIDGQMSMLAFGRLCVAKGA